MKRIFCFEYFSIIACGLTNLNTWTFESLKKIWPFKICMRVPLVYTVCVSVTHCPSGCGMLIYIGQQDTPCLLLPGVFLGHEQVDLQGPHCFSTDYLF